MSSLIVFFIDTSLVNTCRIWTDLVNGVIQIYTTILKVSSDKEYKLFNYWSKPSDFILDTYNFVYYALLYVGLVYIKQNYIVYIKQFFVVNIKLKYIVYIKYLCAVYIKQLCVVYIKQLCVVYIKHFCVVYINYKYNYIVHILPLFFVTIMFRLHAFWLPLSTYRIHHLLV